MGESAFGSRMHPMYLTVCPDADGEEIASQTITETDADTPSYVFENQHAAMNGVRAHCTVQESPVDGFMPHYSTSDGFLTNK